MVSIYSQIIVYEDSFFFDYKNILPLHTAIMFSKPLDSNRTQVTAKLTNESRKLKTLSIKQASQKIQDLRRQIPKNPTGTANADERLEQYRQLQNILSSSIMTIGEVHTSKNHYKIDLSSRYLPGGTSDILSNIEKEEDCSFHSVESERKPVDDIPRSILTSSLGQPEGFSFEGIDIFETPMLKPIKKEDVLQEIHPTEPPIVIEASEVEQLVGLILTAIQASQKTLGRDVVFLIGKTGAGKSTLIHYLNLIQITDISSKPKSSGIRPKPILKFERELQGFRVSEQKTSVTKVINVSSTENNFDIVDSAGLSDTNGFKFNLANTIGLEKAMHNSNSIRMLVVIQESSIFSDQRGKTLITLITELVGYVKNIPIQDFIPTVTIAISHPVYSLEETVKCLGLIYKAEEQTPTVEDKEQRQRVLAFLDSMIENAKLELKKDTIVQKQKQISFQKVQIEKLEEIVKEEKLDKMETKIEEIEEDIKSDKKKQQDANKIEDEDQRKKKIRKLQTLIEQNEQQLARILKKLSKKKQQLKQTLESLKSKKDQLELLKQNVKNLHSEFQKELAEVRSTKTLFNNYSTYYPEQLISLEQAKKAVKSLQQSPRINNPKETFQISIKNEMKTNTQWIVSHLKIDLKEAIEKKNMKTLQNCFTELSLLHQYIPSESIKQDMQKCLEEINGFIRKTCADFRSTVDCSMSDRGLLLPDTIETMLSMLKVMEQADQLIKKLPDFDGEYYSYQGILSSLIMKFEHVSKNIIEGLESKQNFNQVRQTIRKLEILYVNFGAKIPTIKDTFGQFAVTFTNICTSHVEKAKIDVQFGNYESLPAHFTLLNGLKEIAFQHFNLDLKSKYFILLEKCKESLNIRVSKGLAAINSNLSIQKSKRVQQQSQKSKRVKQQSQTSKRVKQQLKEVKNLALNVLLERHLTKQFFQKLQQHWCQFIEEICNNYITLIKNLIFQCSFDEIKDHIFILKDLRQSDEQITSKTANQYISLTLKLQKDLKGDSITKINQIMKKLKTEIPQDQDIELIKSIIQKLEKLQWLDGFIKSSDSTGVGSQGIFGIVKKVKAQLEKHAQNIMNSIENIFNKQLINCEDDDDGSISLTTMQSSFISCKSRNTKFPKLQSSLIFIRQLSLINQKINQCAQKTQETIETLINQQLQEVKTRVESNIKSFKLHEIKLETWLVKLTSMKQIDCNSRIKVNSYLQTLYFTIKSYIESCIKKLEECKMAEDAELKNYVKTFQKIHKSLCSIHKVEKILRKKGINLLDDQTLLKEAVTLKFSNLYEEITKLLKNQSYKSCFEKIQILKKYINSIQIKQITENQPKIQYEKLFNDYTTKAQGLPERINQLFAQKDYESLIQSFNDFKQLGNDKQCIKVKRKLKTNIDNSFQEVESLIIESMQSMDDSISKQINTKFKEFCTYEKLSEIFAAEYKFQEQQKKLLQMIKKYENEKKSKILSKIETKNFDQIKLQIEKINRIYQHVLQGIKLDKSEFVRQDYEKKLKQAINCIIQSKFDTTLKEYAQNLDRLKIYDSQYSKNHTTEYIKKIRAYLANKCKSFEVAVSSIKDINELDNESENFQNMKIQFEQQLSHIEEFKDLAKEFQIIEQTINKQGQIMIASNIYNPQYLDRIRKKHFQVYLERIKQLQNVYQQTINKLTEFLKTQDFKNYSATLVCLEKFRTLTSHESIFQGQPKLEDKITADKKEIYKLTEHVDLQIFNDFDRESLIKIKPQCLKKLKLYFDILKCIEFDSDKDAPLLTKIRSTHKRIGDYFDRTIPKVTQTSSPDQIVKKIKALEQNDGVISMLREYISETSRTTKNRIFYNDLEFSEPINQLDTKNKTLQGLANFLKELPEKIKAHWDKSEFKQIKTKLMQLRRISNDQSISDEFEKIATTIKIFINDLGSQIDESIQNNDFKDINPKLSKIFVAETELKSIDGLILKSTVFDKIKRNLHCRIENQIMKDVMNKIRSRKSEEVVDCLFKLKIWVDNIPLLEQKIHGNILEIFKDAKKQKLTNQIVSILTEKSGKIDLGVIATYCGEILHKYDKELAIQRVMPPLTLSIQEVIAEFKSLLKTSNKLQLKKAYENYNSYFQSLKTTYISKSRPQKTHDNLKAIRVLVQKSIENIHSTFKVNQKSKDNLSKLIAEIFIYISIFRSADKYYDAIRSKTEKADEMLFQPHPIQVLALLKFFGCDNEKSMISSILGFGGSSEIANQFMQIKTGQGKSIILGMVSLMLALLGHNVACVCYSNYLSKRDYDSFRDIFADFKVEKNIVYGTLNEVFNKIVNQNQILRNSVGNMFIDKKIHIEDRRPSKKDEKKNILILDEVDTFFGKDFYGNTYNPCKIIQEDNILAIIRLIWQNKKVKAEKLLYLVKESPHYAQISAKYPDVISKFDRQFRIMIEEVRDFDSKEYVVVDNKIGYKQLDGISFNTVDGYKTMFLYMHEREMGNINQEAEKSIIGINLSCGKYSYAEMIPKFDKIFGVTGTLDCLEFEDKILEKYNIVEKSYAPSVYGKSNRIDQTILIEDTQPKHFNVIATRIQQNNDSSIPCLVFFENQAEIEKFKKSHYIEYFKDNIAIVTEKNEASNRDFLIRKSTVHKSITLFTATFGRGTDFVICDPFVKEKGVAVIQTFLSPELSEQLQIKGRTARQGTRGTYQLILNQESLQNKFDITKDQIDKARQSVGYSVSKLLHDKRLLKIKAMNAERQKKIESIKLVHEESMKSRKKILKNEFSRNESWLFVEYNPSSKARIAILIDSTGSMDEVINAVKGKVMDMIQRLDKSYPNKFQIQILFYYGDNAYEEQTDSERWSSTNKLHASDWTSNTQWLKQFLHNSKASGGSSHEAIEVALHHLIKENQFNGVRKAILIGDAGLEELQDSKLEYIVHPDDAYRYKPDEAKKPIKLKLKDLLDELKKSKIQIDTYPIGQYQNIVETFDLIAKETCGNVTNFDPENDDLAAKLEVVITDQILMKR